MSRSTTLPRDLDTLTHRLTWQATVLARSLELAVDRTDDQTSPLIAAPAAMANEIADEIDTLADLVTARA